MLKCFKRKSYFDAIAVMIGYVIGVGMFGLPFVISKAGVAVFIVFIVFFGMIQYLLHMIYANLILATNGKHRLAGFAEKYLGKKFKYITFIAKTIGNLGALLAYLIITGIFLHELLDPFLGGSEFIYSTFLFVIGAVVVYFGLGAIAEFEFFMTSFLLLVVIMIAVKGWPEIDTVNYISLDWKYFLLPYGAMLMALDGNGSLPLVARLVNRDKKAMKSVVAIGTFIPIIVILLFTFVVVGISGSHTTPDALVGLRLTLDSGVVMFALIFGVLTMATSYILVAESVKETLWWDYKLNPLLSWAIAVFVPYIAFVLGVTNLTRVISFVGGITGGLSAIILLLIFKKLKQKKKDLVLLKYHISDIIIYFLMFLFICGMIYELYYFIFK